MKQSAWAGLALVAGFALISGAQSVEAQATTSGVNANVKARMDARVELKNDMIEIRKDIMDLRSQAKDLRVEAKEMRKDVRMELKASSTASTSRPKMDRATTTASSTMDKPKPGRRIGHFLRSFFGLKADSSANATATVNAQ